ncbi:enhanced intracellular survival protein Eis [Streptomyces sp. NPDC059994]|uniref:GNAT family N-acetyltransferase n=1 Tax=Streptomyces sp. NPDC059994 TaxID=3347029 RepID=UPI0036B6BA34
MAASTIDIVEADDELWRQYDALALRAYGHPVPDIMGLGAHADRRVAVRDGQVIAGGLGLMIPQYFGGRPVPAASTACGCIAPEERGEQLAAQMIARRLEPLREQGAVLATLWTASTGYVRRLGWQAPSQVQSWTIRTDDLKRCFDGSGFEITHGMSEEAHALLEGLASQWNGPWQRPAWWQDWQQQRHPHLAAYRFNRPGRSPSGVLSVAAERHPVEGRQLIVHDFWAADQPTAGAMLAFLGRHNSRIPTVTFQRTGLPPAPLLLHHLHRSGALTSRAWHPWMLRILDLSRAVQLRGWPHEVDLTLPIDVLTEDGTAVEHFTLHIAQGKGDLSPSSCGGQLTLTRGQFAVWYAGGYSSVAAASLAGVRGAPGMLARLLAATAEREPWLADYF